MVTISINLPSCSPFVSYDDVSASSVVHGDYKKSTNKNEKEDATLHKERSEVELVEESRDDDDDLYIATAISMGTDCKTKTLRESLVYDNKDDANEKVLSLQKGDTKSLSQSSRSSIKRELKSKSSINESSPSESIVDKTTRNVFDDCSSMLDGSVNNVTPKKVNHVFELCESCKFGKIYGYSPDLYLTLNIDNTLDQSSI